MEDALKGLIALAGTSPLAMMGVAAVIIAIGSPHIRKWFAEASTENTLRKELVDLLATERARVSELSTSLDAARGEMAKLAKANAKLAAQLEGLETQFAETARLQKAMRTAIKRAVATNDVAPPSNCSSNSTRSRRSPHEPRRPPDPSHPRARPPARHRRGCGHLHAQSTGRCLFASPPLERDLMSSSWDIETRATPSPEKVRQVVQECGCSNALERWSWLDRRTLGRILERDQQGLPAAGRRGRKKAV